MNFSPRKDLIYVTHNVTIEIRECLIMIQKEKAPQIARPLNLDGIRHPPVIYFFGFLRLKYVVKIHYVFNVSYVKCWRINI